VPAAKPPADKTISIILPDQQTITTTTQPLPATTRTEDLQIYLDFQTTITTTVTTRTEILQISLEFPTTTTTTTVTTRTQRYELSLNIETLLASTTTTTGTTGTTGTMVINIILDKYFKPGFKELMKAQDAQKAKSQKILADAQAKANQFQDQAKEIMAKAKIAAAPPPVPAPYRGPEVPPESVLPGADGGGVGGGRLAPLTTSTAPPPDPSMMTTTVNLAALGPCGLIKGGSTPAPPPYLSDVAVNMNDTHLINVPERVKRKWKKPGPTMIPIAQYSGTDLQALADSRFQATLDCALSPWSEWSVCADISGMDLLYSSRHRSTVNPQKKGGRACPDSLSDQRPCKSSRRRRSGWEGMLGEWHSFR
jgi:hypothetical protein